MMGDKEGDSEGEEGYWGYYDSWDGLCLINEFEVILYLS